LALSQEELNFVECDTRGRSADDAAAGPVARSAEDYLAHLDTYYQ